MFFKDEPIQLERNSVVMLSSDKKCSYSGNLLYGIYVNCKCYIKFIHIGSYIRIDNKMLLMVKDKSEDYLQCMVMIGGVLKSHADVQFPYLPHRDLTPEEKEDFRFVFYEKSDFICCRSITDRDYYKFVRSIFIKEQQNMVPFYCAPNKILNASAVKEICKTFDGIIVNEQNQHEELIAKECKKLLKAVLIDYNSPFPDRQFVDEKSDSIIVKNDFFKKKISPFTAVTPIEHEVLSTQMVRTTNVCCL